MSEKSNGCAYINGEYYSTDEAKISIYDRGFSGVSVFDATSLLDGYVFKVDPHIDRFFKSLQAARIDPALSKHELREVIFETVRRSGLKKCGIVFMIATTGAPEIPMFEKSGPKPSMIVSVTPFQMPPAHLPDDTFTKGIRVHISNVRNIPPQCLDQRIKNFNRLHHYLAMSEALDAGVHDVIMLDLDGYVSEGIYCNVWIALGGRLYTPAGDMLRGITRETVFEMAESMGIETGQVQMTPYDLYTADEVFLCSSGGGVLPVVEIDRRTIADGSVGPIAEKLINLYGEWHRNPKYAVRVVE
jgi:branched-chain amino acid aminotransferase